MKLICPRFAGQTKTYGEIILAFDGAGVCRVPAGPGGEVAAKDFQRAHAHRGMRAEAEPDDGRPVAVAVGFPFQPPSSVPSSSSFAELPPEVAHPVFGDVPQDQVVDEDEPAVVEAQAPANPMDEILASTAPEDGSAPQAESEAPIVNKRKARRL